MEILKYGKEPVYYMKCCICSTEFTYNTRDMNYAGVIGRSIVYCPFCAASNSFQRNEKISYDPAIHGLPMRPAYSSRAEKSQI